MHRSLAHLYSDVTQQSHIDVKLRPHVLCGGEAMSQEISLIVDDEQSVRTYIKAVLQSDGFQTLEAENGLQALELVRKLGTGLDLLISDIQMPIMDGITLAEALRAELPTIPLILVSGCAEIRQANIEAEFEFVQKPFLPATLLTIVDKVMRAKRTASSD